MVTFKGWSPDVNNHIWLIHICKNPIHTRAHIMISVFIKILPILLSLYSHAPTTGACHRYHLRCSVCITDGGGDLQPNKGGAYLWCIHRGGGASWWPQGDLEACSEEVLPAGLCSCYHRTVNRKVSGMVARMYDAYNVYSDNNCSMSNIVYKPNFQTWQHA